MPETIYDALRESHEIQRSLCRKLLRSKPGTAARADIFKQLRVELAAHEAAEERYLYVPMLMDDMGLSASRHALHEHHELDELVEDLQVTDKSGSGWMATAKKLSEKVHHHLREEEKKFFQVSGKIISEVQKVKLAKSYRRDYERVLKLAGRSGA
ncbi:hemerythrin domain-containing protein [Tahibacter sp.]|uniref:hemerythrin domain-containing protein n=1 Tax=Tahibacter sp. TaxID=2056211 RepID=UPI0028C477C5|nr:hemerythrin domain-containing protein [Tahibacter sp.]